MLVDALDDHLATLDQRRLERAGGERLAELAAIFPALDGPAVPDGALQAERYRAHRAVQELLDGLAVGRPLLLALDDLHWADQASLEVVASLLRRPPDGPVLLACAFRPAPAPGFLESALAAAEREGRAAADRPRPADARGRRGAAGRRSRSRACATRCSASPAATRSTSRSSRAWPPPRRSGPARARQVDTLTLGVPQSVLSMLAEEIRMLPPESRRVLEAAAVAGEPFEPDVAAEIGEVSEAEVIVALDDLLARDLVRAHRRPAPVPLPPPARAPRRLRARGRRLAARRARPRGGGAARRAARRRRRRPTTSSTPRGAATRRRSRCCGEPRPSARRARARHGGALAAGRRAARARGRVAAGRRAARRAADRARRRAARVRAARAVPDDAAAGARRSSPADDRAARRARHRLRGRRALARPARRGARAARRGAGRARAPSAPPARCALRVERAVEHLYALDFAAARAVAEDAARARGGARRRRVALAARGAVLSADGGGRRGRRARRASSSRTRRRGIDALRDAELADDLATLWYLGWAELHLERFEAGARAPAARGIAISRAAGRGDLIVPMLLGQARGAARARRAPSEATELTDEAIEVARGSGNPQYVVWALWAARRGSRCWRATTRRRRCSPRRRCTSARDARARRCSSPAEPALDARRSR